MTREQAYLSPDRRVTHVVTTGGAIQFTSSLVDNKHKFLDGRLNLLIRIVRFSHT